MHDPLLAIEIDELTVRVGVVGTGGLVGSMREFVGTASLEDQIDRAKLAAGWLQAPGKAIAVVTVHQSVDYLAGRVDQAGVWASPLSVQALGDRLGRPVMLACRTDILAVGQARSGVGAGFGRIAYLDLDGDANVALVASGRLERAAHRLREAVPTVNRESNSGTRIPGIAEALAVLIDRYRPDAIVLSGRDAAEREQVCRGLERVRSRAGHPDAFLPDRHVAVLGAESDRSSALRASADWVDAQRENARRLERSATALFRTP